MAARCLGQTPVATRSSAVVAFPSKLDGAHGDSVEEKTLSRAGLRHVHDTPKKLLGADIKDGPKTKQMKSIWVVALHGEADEHRLKIDENRFKGSAWGHSRGQRVFAQMTGVGVRGEYDVDDDDEGRTYRTVEIVFDAKKNAETYPADALKTWVSDLAARYGAEEDFDMFKRLDMRMYQDAPAPKTRTKLKGENVPA